LQIDSNFTDPKVSSCDYTFVSGAFSQLIFYLRNAIDSSLGVPSSDATTDSDISHAVLKNLDLRLPKVSAAIVLLAQILNVICLRVHEFGSSNQSVGSGFQAVSNAIVNEMVIKGLIGKDE
jgi:ataxin-10